MSKRFGENMQLKDFTEEQRMAIFRAAALVGMKDTEWAKDVIIRAANAQRVTPDSE
jgi:hypothetical protein